MGGQIVNYLQLCNKVKDAAGIAGPDIQDVNSTEPHINKLICDWVKNAWIEIQSDRKLRGVFNYEKNATFILPEQRIAKEYSYRDFMLPEDITWDFDQFFWTDKLLNGLPAAKLLKRDSAAVNVMVPVEKEPRFVVPTSPNSFYLAPTNQYRIILIANYWTPPQELSDNSDIPEGISSQDQPIIAYLALVFYGIYDAAEEIIKFADAKYREYLERVYHNYSVNTQPNRVTYNRFV